MTDVAIRASQTSSAPRDYTIPGAQQLLPKSVSASMDGTSASGAWFPALQFLDPGGHVMITCVPDSSFTALAVGVSADVNWFPKLRPLGGTTPSPSPNPLGTVWAWWDFSDTSTITLDGSSKIVQITDKSGNGHTLVAPSAGQRPAESTLNGLNCGLFNSAAQTMLDSSGPWVSPLSQPYTIFVVYTQSLGPAANYIPGPFGGNRNIPPPVLFENLAGGNVVFQDGVNNVSAPLASPFTQQQVTMIADGASSHLRLNAVDHAGTVDVNQLADSVIGSSHFPAGATIEQLDGKVGEVLVYESHLSAAQLSAVESYLKTKWATP